MLECTSETKPLFRSLQLGLCVETSLATVERKYFYIDAPCLYLQVRIFPRNKDICSPNYLGPEELQLFKPGLRTLFFRSPPHLQSYSPETPDQPRTPSENGRPATVLPSLGDHSGGVHGCRGRNSVHQLRRNPVPQRPIVLEGQEGG